MPRASNGPVELDYELDGPADAPVVTFVEGLGYGRWMWRWQRERLSDYRTLVFDNRGTGESDKPEGPYTMAQMAADLDAVLRDAGVESTALVGASMGGMISQEYAIEYDRADAVALLCTTHGGEDAVPIPEETQAKMFQIPEGLDEREAIRYKMAVAMSEEFWNANEDVVEDIVDWRLDSDAPDPARNAQAAAVQGFDASDRLHRLTQPALVMHGTGDRVVPVANARLLHDRLPDSELELFEDAPHLFFIERADAVTDRLRRFLDRTLRESQDARP